MEGYMPYSWTGKLNALQRMGLILQLNSGSSSSNGRVVPIRSTSFLTVTKDCGRNKKHSYLNALENNQNQARTEGKPTPGRMKQHWVSFPCVHSLQSEARPQRVREVSGGANTHNRTGLQNQRIEFHSSWRVRGKS